MLRRLIGGAASILGLIITIMVVAKVVKTPGLADRLGDQLATLGAAIADVVVACIFFVIDFVVAIIDRLFS